MAPLSLVTAKPCPFALPENRTALVVIDMQKDFLLKNGYGYLQCPSEEVFEQVSSVIEPTAKAIAAARKLGLHVIHTREGHVSDLSDCPPTKRLRQATANPDRHKLVIGTDGPMGRLLVRGSDGHDIVDEVKPLRDEPVLDKPGKGSFYNTDFHQMLVSRGITHILLAGVTTECCVATTFREANDHGFECCVLTDCTGGFDGTIVSATMDLFCAYDGLLGYNCSSKPLLELAATVSSIPPSVGDGVFDISVASLRSAYRTTNLTPAKVMEYIYEQIAKPESAVIFSKVIDREDALKALPEPAIVADVADMPYFYGIPFTVSENFDIENSKLIKDLLASGAILIGSTKIEYTGVGVIGVSNPEITSEYSDEYIAGGYSYGPALAIAKGLGSFALGLDTDGSARIPAAFSGVVGYNVSKGLLPSDNIAKFCPSVDSVTIIATTVPDARAVFAELRGQDLTDPYSVPDRVIPIKSVDYRGPKDGGFRFAVPDDLSLLSSDYKTGFAAFIEKAESLGGTMVDIDWSVVTKASKLVGPLLDVERVAFSTASTSADPVVAKVQEAVNATAAGMPAFKVFQDMDALRLLKTELYMSFEGAAGIDVIISPAAPYHPTFADVAANPVDVNGDLSIFTKHTNAFDMCAVTLKANEYGPLKLPFGVMISAPMGMDGRMLDIAQALA
ncbi:amidase signature domain-containing protein [Lipomyces kononenkoae]|uniref:Amidase signature domain-containing protein n=1 Tax=Lipomyces kononenkoae TaxID=34357 RepID=A0ACC3T933_LIPKO